MPIVTSTPYEVQLLKIFGDIPLGTFESSYSANASLTTEDSNLTKYSQSEIEALYTNYDIINATHTQLTIGALSYLNTFSDTTLLAISTYYTPDYDPVTDLLYEE